MVTNYPHPIASSREVVEVGMTEGLGERVLDRVRQALCGLHGHDALMHFEQERMFLKCASCGHETPGWELNEPRPIVRVRGDARRHAITRPQLVDERRIA
jgi:hypothetical protein